MPPGDELFRFPAAVKRDADVDEYLRRHPQVEPWFSRLRACGEDVRETMHDGWPTACVDDAAFAHVAAHQKHVSVYFFFGALLDDPRKLLAGTGKRGRHVKLKRAEGGAEVDVDALQQLLLTAYADIRARLGKR